MCSSRTSRSTFPPSYRGCGNRILVSTIWASCKWRWLRIPSSVVIAGDGLKRFLLQQCLRGHPGLGNSVSNGTIRDSSTNAHAAKSRLRIPSDRQPPCRYLEATDSDPRTALHDDLERCQHELHPGDRPRLFGDDPRSGIFLRQCAEPHRPDEPWSSEHRRRWATGSSPTALRSPCMTNRVDATKRSTSNTISRHSGLSKALLGI